MCVTGDRTDSLQSLGDQRQRKQQQANIEQVTSEMGVMRNELGAQEADEAKQEMFVIYCRTDAQCVGSGWWLSQHDRAGEAHAWSARETKGSRLENGSTKARARERPRSRSSRIS